MKRIALAAFCAALAAPLPAARFAGVDVPAPLPARPVVETHWGTQVEDPYRYFEDTKDAGVQAWMKSQADATEAILAKIPGREGLLARIREIESQASGLADNVVRTRNGRYFYEKRDPKDNQFRLVWRERADGPDKLIFDPEALARQTGTPHAVMDFAPSPDGRHIAYAVQKGGGEIGTLHVVELATGREVIPPIDRIRYASVTWLDDGSGFFYARLREGYDKLPEDKRFGDHAAHFVALAAPAADRRVFSASHNAELDLPEYAQGIVFQVPGTKLAAAWVFLGVERHRLYYLADLEDAKHGKAKWRQVVAKDDQAAEIWPAGGYLYVRTSKGAPRFRVVRTPLAAPDIAKAEVVVPATSSVVTNIRAARDALYVVRRDGATQSLWRLPHARKAKLERVALPFEGSVRLTDGFADRDGVAMSLSGWTRAAKPYAFDPGRGLRQLPFVAPGAFDAPQDIVAREVRVRSHDGVEIPLSILARPDAKLDGTNPTILYGYGAYGITENPFFNPRLYAWVARGGVYAFAHVRGGGAFGEEWHHAGRKTTKPNTWKDAIAAAEWLIANGYTSKTTARHLWRQCRRHLRRSLDHRAPGPLRRGRAGGGRVRRRAFRNQRQWGRQHSGVRHGEGRGGVSRTARDEHAHRDQGRDALPRRPARARRQRHPRAGVGVAEGGRPVRLRHDERKTGAHAPRVRQRPRAGQHARAVAEAQRRHLVVLPLAVRRARIPAEGYDVMLLHGAALAALLAALRRRAATFAGVDVPPPLPAQPVVDTHWGVAVDDPYRFLEDTADPAVQKWMRAQADATRAILDRLPGRAKLAARIAEIEAAAPASHRQRRSAMRAARLTYLKRAADENQFKLYRRDRVDAPGAAARRPRGDREGDRQAARHRRVPDLAGRRARRLHAVGGRHRDRHAARHRCGERARDRSRRSTACAARAWRGCPTAAASSTAASRRTGRRVRAPNGSSTGAPTCGGSARHGDDRRRVRSRRPRRRAARPQRRRGRCRRSPATTSRSRSSGTACSASSRSTALALRRARRERRAGRSCSTRRRRCTASARPAAGCTCAARKDAPRFKLLRMPLGPPTSRRRGRRRRRRRRRTHRIRTGARRRLPDAPRRRDRAASRGCRTTPRRSSGSALPVEGSVGIADARPAAATARC